ncbi:MAG: hypothetical protein ACI92Z_002294 [Paracoccaceae bacterium]|jgi:hypothetical protein
MLFQKSLKALACGDPYLTENEVAVMLLKAILEQKDPRIQALLIEKLGNGPSGVLVADCIERLSQLGLTVQAPQEGQATVSQNNKRSFVHRTHRTVQ